MDNSIIWTLVIVALTVLSLALLVFTAIRYSSRDRKREKQWDYELKKQQLDLRQQLVEKVLNRSGKDCIELMKILTGNL